MEIESAAAYVTPFYGREWAETKSRLKMIASVAKIYQKVKSFSKPAMC